MKPDPTSQFVLLQRDQHNELWLRLTGYLDERLEHLRRKNDNDALSAEQTAALRGRISELKWLLGSIPSPD